MVKLKEFGKNSRVRAEKLNEPVAGRYTLLPKKWSKIQPAWHTYTLHFYTPYVLGIIYFILFLNIVVRKNQNSSQELKKKKENKTLEKTLEEKTLN